MADIFNLKDTISKMASPKGSMMNWDVPGQKGIPEAGAFTDLAGTKDIISPKSLLGVDKGRLPVTPKAAPVLGMAGVPTAPQTGPMSMFDVEAHMAGVDVPVTTKMPDGRTFDAGTTSSMLAKSQAGMPAVEGWGDKLTAGAGVVSALAQGFGAWTAYKGLEETKDVNKRQYALAAQGFRNQVQDYNRNLKDQSYTRFSDQGFSEAEAQAKSDAYVEKNRLEGI